MIKASETDIKKDSTAAMSIGNDVKLVEDESMVVPQTTEHISVEDG